MGLLYSFKPHFFRIGRWHVSHMEGLRLKSWASKTEIMYSAIESLLLKGRNNECICKTLQSKFLIIIWKFLFDAFTVSQSFFTTATVCLVQIAWVSDLIYKLRTTYLKLKIIQKTSIWCLKQAKLGGGGGVAQMWKFQWCWSCRQTFHWVWRVKYELFRIIIFHKLLIKPLMVKGD